MNEFYLVDTNAWIGFFEGRKGFSPKIREIMSDESWACFISIASIWEAAIKVGLGKLRLAYDLKTDLPRILEDNGFEILPLEFEDVVGVRDLPPVHGDPFDRIQAIQVQRRGWQMLSHDPIFDAYGIKRIG
ncbi:MAG: type II toxin-antitoxin system VapC family toxin [Verrucomicrobia bacterium]|nr:type II toxin-antitoxin system VapC family toxin [Verrucomicrobiota bacterium]MCH8514299.1 type II toxin-antitoxin system VapC family toxin [Kiritimatiellia bacterium]